MSRCRTADMNRRIPIRFTINGVQVRVSVKTNEVLLQTIRTTLGLTGTKQGCNRAQCGACTVLLNGVPRYSCITLTALVPNSNIVSIEGVAPSPEELSQLQIAFIEQHGHQCGFCTSGMIMSAQALLDSLGENDPLSPDDIKRELGGHICRCGNYENIIRAIVWCREKGR